MDFKGYIVSSLEEEAKNIREHFPEGISEQQKRTASVVLEFVKKQAIGILDKNPDFDWKHFDDFCDTFMELIDSRNKRPKSSVTGISYEGVYQKQKIEWLLDILGTSLGRHEKNILSQELGEIFENALEKGMDRKTYIENRFGSIRPLRRASEGYCGTFESHTETHRIGNKRGTSWTHAGTS